MKIANNKEILQGLVGIFVIILLAASFIGDDADEAAPQPTEAATATNAPPQHWLDLDRSEEMQARRLSLIEGLQQEGVILKIETPTDYPRIYVGDQWAALTFDDKQAFANSILTYYYAQNPASKAAVIRDGYSGNDIGRFTYDYGLELR